MEARVLSDAAVVAAVEYDPLTGVLRRKIDGYCGYQGWCAHIRDHGKARHLGTFRTAEEAHAAYVAAAKEVFGEFARVA